MTGWEVRVGDSLEVLAQLDAESVDAVVCDPPYGLGFMGREWDVFERRAFQSWCEAWAREALRVLKPGGHLLAFGGTRTAHRLVCGIEDAGFEVRDTIAWMYGSGFPKSLDVGKAIDAAAGATREVLGPNRYDARRSGTDLGRMNDDGWEPKARVDTAPATPDAERWQGWGTALKPAHEPIVVARKPLAGNVAATVLEHGTGALNVDGCRIGTTADDPNARAHKTRPGAEKFRGAPYSEGMNGDGEGWAPALGRWPANVVLDPEAAAMLDEQTGPTFSARRFASYESDHQAGAVTGTNTDGNGRTRQHHEDSGGASRFFYVAKASSAERNAGLDGFEKGERVFMGSGGRTMVDGQWIETHSEPQPRANVHPTVKPIDLMRWLVRLVTPPGGLVLDPFTGSGTTGCAAVLERFRFVGIERDPEYATIARARIAWWAEHPDGMELVQRLEAERERKAVAESGQLDLFAPVPDVGSAA